MTAEHDNDATDPAGTAPEVAAPHGTNPEPVSPVGSEQWAREVLDSADADTELGLAAARDAMAVAAGELDEAEFRDRYEVDYLKEFGTDRRPRLADGLTRRYTEPAVTGRPPAAPPLAGSGDCGSGGGGGCGCGDADDIPASVDGGGLPTVEAGAADTPAAVSRRSVMRALGGTAVAALFFAEAFRRGAFAAPGDTPGIGDPLPLAGEVRKGAGTGTVAPGEQLGVQYGMVIDLERCDGCMECVRACSDDHGLSDGVLWPYVFAYQEPERDDTIYMPRMCQHCTRAPCVMVCPTGARHRRLADGLVLTDYDVCIGCRYCQVACPYGVNVFQFEEPATTGASFVGHRRDARGIAVEGPAPKGVMSKCTLCPIRQENPETAGSSACVDVCGMNALHIGDLNDPESPPNRYLAQRREAAGGNLPTFRLLEELGTEPNIIYIGQPPSARAEIVEGDWGYEDVGLTDDRRAVLEGPEPWFRRMARGGAA